jgi:hypothetical protein
MSAANSKVVTLGPTLGTGSHTAQLLLAEDFYAGDVQVTISVNGVQLGGVQTVTAQQANSAQELFTLKGNWTGTPAISVNFMNDAWNGSTGNGNDRNLYIDGISYDGVTVSTAIRPVLWSGPAYLSTKPVTRVADFLATIGVTTHLLYGDTSYHDEAKVLTSLKYLGIDHVRDGGSMLDPNAVLPFEQAMAAGIKFNFTANPDGGVANNIARLDTLVAAYPGGISSIEGINEVSSSFSNAGLSGQAGALKFQQDLFAAVKADPALAAIPVINYTVLSEDPTDYTRLGDVSATADLGNIHLYPYGGLQTQTSTLLPRELQGTPHSAGYVITEFGYDTMLNASNIQAKYVLDGVLDAYQAGASKTYLYELLDDNPDPGMTNVQDHFGLFNADGSPKPAATALHNMTSILADPGGVSAGAFTPGTLGYTVIGLPATGSSMLLAKSDGSFDLAVWAEPQIRASQTSPGEIAAPSIPITINFDQSQKSLLVYDPLLGPSPLNTYSNINTITLTLTDHPLVLEIGKPVASINPHPIISTITGNRDGGVTLSGTSEPNSSIVLLKATATSTADFGHTTVSGLGKWQFTSHEKISMAQINSFTVQGQDQLGNISSGPEDLRLFSNGIDTILAQAGVSETFSIMSSSGKDTIHGFQTSLANPTLHDFINFSGRGLSSFDQVKPIISGTTSAILTLGSGKTITLENVLPASLTRTDFIFS